MERDYSKYITPFSSIFNQQTSTTPPRIRSRPNSPEKEDKFDVQRTPTDDEILINMFLNDDKSSLSQKYPSDETLVNAYFKFDNGESHASSSQNMEIPPLTFIRSSEKFIIPTSFKSEQEWETLTYVSTRFFASLRNGSKTIIYQNEIATLTTALIKHLDNPGCRKRITKKEQDDIMQTPRGKQYFEDILNEIMFKKEGYKKNNPNINYQYKESDNPYLYKIQTMKEGLESEALTK